MMVEDAYNRPATDGVNRPCTGVELFDTPIRAKHLIAKFLGVHRPRTGGRPFVIKANAVHEDAPPNRRSLEKRWPTR